MMVYHKSYMPPLAYNLFQLFQLHMIECLHMHQSLIQLGIFAWQHRSKLKECKVEQAFEQIPKTKVTWKWTFDQNCHFFRLKICCKTDWFYLIFKQDLRYPPTAAPTRNPMKVIEVKNEFNQDESQIKLYSVTKFNSLSLNSKYRLIASSHWNLIVPIVLRIVELSNSISQFKSHTSVCVALKNVWLRWFDQSDSL